MGIQLQISSLAISNKPQIVIIQCVYTQEFRNNLAKDSGCIYSILMGTIKRLGSHDGKKQISSGNTIGSFLTNA